MDIIVIGFALFAMFFGAGNLIFPPLMGYNFADKWLIAGIGFSIVGVGLTLLAVLSMTKKKGDIFSFTGLAGKRFSTVIILIIALCIGPLGAIPRTGATSYEIVSEAGFDLPAIVFALVFFGLTIFFCLSKNGIIDVVGKFLTPGLLIALGLMIISGLVNPIGGIKATPESGGEVLAKSMVEGYNTMDAIAALAFAPVIISDVMARGYEDDLFKKVLQASLVAIVGLAAVYICLTYLGATSSLVAQEGISRVGLLIFISEQTLGAFGKYVLSIAIILACFTTAIGLISSIADIFVRLSGDRLPYKKAVWIIGGLSFFLSILGVEEIINLVNPFLQFIYPINILLIFYNFFDEKKLDRLLVRNTIGTVGVVSFIQALSSMFGLLENLFGNLGVFEGLNQALKRIIGLLPLGEAGFARILPFVISLIGSLLYLRLRQRGDVLVGKQKAYVRNEVRKE